MLISQTTAVWAVAPNPSIAPPPPGAIETDAGTVSQPITLSAAKDFAVKVGEVFKPILGNITLSFAGYLRPSQNILRTFNLDLVTQMFTGAYAPLTPKAIQEQTVHFDPAKYPLQISGRTRLCFSNPLTGESVTSVSHDIYYSQALPELNYLNEHGRQYASYFSGRKQNTLDFTQPPTVIGMNLPPCGATDLGTEGEPKELDAAQQNTFVGGPGNPVEIVIKNTLAIFDALLSRFPGGKIRSEATLLNVNQTPYADETSCAITGTDCGGEGGALLTFSPRLHDPTRGQINASQNNPFDINIADSGGANVETRFTKTKAVENTGDYALCMLLPKTLQDKYLIDASSKCQPVVSQPTGGCGSGQLPDLKTKGSCKLCGADTSEILSLLTPAEQKQLPEGKLPDLMIKILQKAGETFNVPPAALVGMMYNEGAFTFSDWDWTEENVKKWSVCGGEVPNCLTHAHPVTKARGPFGWIDSWFREKTDYYKAVLEVDRSRPLDQINQCNFLDAAFAAAKALQKTSGGHAGLPQQCLGQELLQGEGPAASCGQWDEKRAATGQRMHSGECIEAVPRTVNFFRTLNCK